MENRGRVRRGQDPAVPGSRRGTQSTGLNPNPMSQIPPNRSSSKPARNTRSNLDTMTELLFEQVRVDHHLNNWLMGVPHSVDKLVSNIVENLVPPKPNWCGFPILRRNLHINLKSEIRSALLEHLTKVSNTLKRELSTLDTQDWREASMGVHRKILANRLKLSKVGVERCLDRVREFLVIHRQGMNTENPAPSPMRCSGNRGIPEDQTLGEPSTSTDLIPGKVTNRGGPELPVRDASGERGGAAFVTANPFEPLMDLEEDPPLGSPKLQRRKRPANSPPQVTPTTITISAQIEPRPKEPRTGDILPETCSISDPGPCNLGDVVDPGPSILGKGLEPTNQRRGSISDRESDLESTWHLDEIEPSPRDQRVDLSHPTTSLKLSVYQSKRNNPKSVWKLHTREDTKVLIIGDSNLKFASELDPEWEVHSYSGGSFQNLQPIIDKAKISKNISDIVVCLGINHHRSNFVSTTRPEFNKLIHSLSAHHKKIHVMGVPIATSYNPSIQRAMGTLNDFLKEKSKEGRFKYFEPTPTNIEIHTAPSDLTGIHLDRDSVSTILENIRKYLDLN